MSRGGITRRAVLRGAAGATLAVPLLQLPPRRAGAAERFPKRLLVFYTPNGTRKELWSPPAEEGETGFSLPPLLQPLARHRDKLIILDGLNLEAGLRGPGGPHQRAMASLLTGAVITEGDFVGGDGRRAGWGGGISVDQYAAQALRPPTRLATLELGVLVKENVPRGRMVYRGPRQPVPPENDPVAAWRRVFAGMEMAPDEHRRQLARRRSVLDAVWQDFHALERRLAAPDRAKLQQHAESLRDLERRLGVLVEAPSSCERLEPPAALPHMDEGFFDRVGRLQMDLLVMALACDITRIATLQWSTAVNHVRFTFLGLHDHQGHSLSHAGDSNADMQAQWVRMLTWYAEQFAYLLDRLDAVPEGDGTLLDNTLVLWCNELSRGNSHDLRDIPFLIAGRAGGALRTGRHLIYDHRPHNDLLLSILHVLGVEAATFGEPDLCTGPLPGLV